RRCAFGLLPILGPACWPFFAANWRRRRIIGLRQEDVGSRDGLIFQAIKYVFQDFVLECDQSVLLFPPVPTSIVRGVDRWDFNANGRTRKLAAKNPAHSASWKDLGGNNKHRSRIPFGPLPERHCLISGIFARGSKCPNSTGRHTQLQECFAVEYAMGRDRAHAGCPLLWSLRDQDLIGKTSSPQLRGSERPSFKSSTEDDNRARATSGIRDDP